MKYNILLLFFIAAIGLSASAQQPDKRAIRIVDTLTAQEKNTRIPVLLRLEIDSLIKLYDTVAVQTVLQEPVKPKKDAAEDYLLIAGIISLMLIAFLLYLLFRNQKKFNHTISRLNRQIQQLEFVSNNSNKQADSLSVAQPKVKGTAQSLEKKLQLLTIKLDKTETEQQQLEQDYTQMQQAYETIKQQMMNVYKIRNYPGYAKDKSEEQIIKDVLDTERSVVLYAYEQFLKPVIAIADENKNNPAKINPENAARMTELLLSLSLFYSEYLYLRVNELSIGGKMVERIAGFKKGNTIDTALLKELNTQHGSRALALRMVLDKIGVQQLSYPVFDETNLNLS